MAKIKISSQYITGALTVLGEEMFGGNRGFGGTGSDEGIYQNAVTRANRLVLYRGTVPTLEDLKSPAFAGNSSSGMPRYADRLIVFNYVSQYEGFSDGAFNFKETTHTVAQLSGQATWFAMMAWNSATSYCMIVGDISDLNGDGVIKMENTNITINDRYLMKRIKLRFPMEFEY